MKKAIAAAALAAALATGTAGIAMAQQGVSDTEIVIGSNGDLSGVFAAFNVQAIKAAQLKFDEVNEAGGINGRKIRFVVEDHGYDPARAQQNFNKLVNGDKVFAMLLNLGTPHNIAGFPIMAAKQVANISPLTAARQMIEGDITYKYTGGSSYYDQIKVALDLLSKQNGAKELCSMYFPTDFGLEVFEGTRDASKELNLTYAGETQHRPDEQDFTGALGKLREAGCDIVTVAVGVRQIGIILGTAKKLGWNDVTFLGSSAGFNTVIAKFPGGVAEGYHAAASWSDLENRMDNPDLKKWAEAFQAKFNEAPGTAAQLGGSAAQALVMALEKAGKDLTPESFKAAMESLEYDDFISDVHVKYGPDDHQGGDLIVVSKVEGGVWKEVGRQ